MKIRKVEIKDIKKIEFAEISPTENVIYITGKNGQGKSSLLDALFSVFGGKNSLPEMPLNQNTGAKNGHVTVELDNGLRLIRKVSAAGTTLTIESETGEKITSPQKYVEEKLKYFSFNPAEFYETTDPKKRAGMIKEILNTQYGNDFSVLGNLYQKSGYQDGNIIEYIDSLTNDKNGILYLSRRKAGELIKMAPENKNIELGDFDIESKKEELQELESQLQKNDENSQKIIRIISNIKNTESSYKISYESIPQPVKDTRIQEYLNFGQIIENALEALGEAGGNIQAKRTDIEEQIREIRESISEYLQNKSEIERYQEKLNQYREAINEYDKLDNLIKELRIKRENLIGQAKLPLEGMEMDGYNITVKGIPFEQLSQSEKIIASVNVAMALNPELKVMRVLNGNLLDSETFEYLKKIITDNDYQLWIEYIQDENTGIGYFIENGKITG
ncbi:MAG: AAA family ATPase [Bacteroidota bacterium]